MSYINSMFLEQKQGTSHFEQFVAGPFWWKQPVRSKNNRPKATSRSPHRIRVRIKETTFTIVDLLSIRHRSTKRLISQYCAFWSTPACRAVFTGARGRSPNSCFSNRFSVVLPKTHEQTPACTAQTENQSPEGMMVDTTVCMKDSM